MKQLIVILGPNGVGKSTVSRELREFDLKILKIILNCTLEENIKRMRNDRRDEERIERAINKTRHIYDALPYPQIDTTLLTPPETARIIAERYF